ncbi:MAG: hypothetical protein ACE5JN_09840 [Candidatus Methylomirabilia bacterium]
MSDVLLHMRAAGTPSKMARQEVGLTLIQILVAVAVFVTGLAAVATGFHLAIGRVETLVLAGAAQATLPEEVVGRSSSTPRREPAPWPPATLPNSGRATTTSPAGWDFGYPAAL